MIINQILAVPPKENPKENKVTFQRLDGATTMTLPELHENADRLARALRNHGIKEGDRIGILAANGPEWVLLDLAALKLKAVTAGFEPGKFHPTQDLADRYRLAVIFTDQPAQDSTVRPITDVRSLVTESGPPTAPTEYGPKDITTIKFTSGSTGEPKGLAATAGSIDASISAVQQMFGHGGDDNLFLFLPLSLLQQRYWIYSALRFGHDITISTYEAAFPALRRTRPTVIMGVPAFYEAAKKHMEHKNHLFGDRIRYLWTGSAPARPEMLRFFTEAGMPIYEGYGLNETCIVAKNHPGAHREGSVGQVLPGKKVLFDADGLISVHSDHPVNTRYEYAAPGESERVFAPDGTVRTGDIGYLDDDGFLYIKGRADDVIVLDNGRNILVRPLEEYLKASPAIEECVVLCPERQRLIAIVSPADPPDKEAITARVTAANAAFETEERIDGLVVAPEPFSIGNGMLTSQYKPRRRRIADAYLPRIQGARDGI